jgi:hypothetical protein
MDGRVWFGPREDTARAWGAEPAPAPRWLVDASAELPFEDPTAALDAFALDDVEAEAQLDAEGLIAGAAMDGHHESNLYEPHHTEVVPFYQSNDYMLFQAQQAHMNAIYGTNNGVDWNLNGIVGY